MLSITKKTGYALIAMIHLARLPQRRHASARDISERYGVPLPLLMNVLKKLSAGGLVESVRGARGGYRISMSPEEVNFADLIEAMEGPMKLAQCVADGKGGEGHGTACRVLAHCPIVDPVNRVHQRIRDCLSGLSLAEILRGQPQEPQPLGRARGGAK